MKITTFRSTCSTRGPRQWRIQKILVGGGFEAQNLKNSDVFTKIETDFSAEIGNSNVFFAQIQVVSKKKKKKKGLHQNWDWFFAGLVTFRSVGGDASRNGADLFETEADFSAKIVTFRLVGGDASPPIPPPKSATGPRPPQFKFNSLFNQHFA